MNNATSPLPFLGLPLGPGPSLTSPRGSWPPETAKREPLYWGGSPWTRTTVAPAPEVAHGHGSGARVSSARKQRGHHGKRGRQQAFGVRLEAVSEGPHESTLRAESSFAPGTGALGSYASGGQLDSQAFSGQRAGERAARRGALRS